jgi:hypothetical protein
MKVRLFEPMMFGSQRNSRVRFFRRDQSARTVTAKLGAIFPPDVAVISVTVTFLATSGFRGGVSGGNFDMASFTASPKSNFAE